MNLTLEIIIGAVIAVIASVAIVIKNVETVAKAWSAYVKEPAEERRRKREDDSHKPIFERLEKIEKQKIEISLQNSEALDDIKKMLEIQARNLIKDRRITRASAMALISLYTDLHLKGEPNGSSQTDIQELRNLIYRPDLTDDEL